MSQTLYRNRTNNHLSWVMVNSADFATPESALSAATKIKIYGKLRGAAGVNFVSSGTGSLTNDIQHVGASALGLYTIALVQADLSDASAAWYDQYIVALSATGAARQVLICEGKQVDDSYLSNILSNLSAVVSDIRSDVSDMHSDLLVMSGILSDCYSAVLVTQSAASDAASAAAQANSRVLVVQSLVSDVDSALTSRFSDLLSLLGVGVQINASSLSDLRSAISAGPAATITASDISDIASAVWATALGTKLVSLNPSDLSDLRSAITAGGGALSVSNISDIASAVWAAKYAVNSNASSFGSLMNVTTTPSEVSDLTSAIASAVWATALGTKLVSINPSDLSDLRSAIAAGAAATITASDISDIASAVWATALGTKLVSLNPSDLSDLRSAITAGGGGGVSASDISDILSAAQQANSRLLVNQSRVSDIYSLLSDVSSDLGVMSGVQSDLYSAVSDLSSQFGAPITELTQAIPSATPTLKQAIMLPYMALRNKETVDSGFLKIHNDAGTVIAKKPLADNGTTYTESEMIAGP